MLCWLAPLVSHAHPTAISAAQATIEADGRFRVVAQFDTLAFALNDTSARIGNEPMEALLAGPHGELAAALADARGRFLHGFRVVTDRGPGRVETVDFPAADQVLEWKATTRPVLPVILPVQLTGHLPAGAGTVAFRFPDVLEQVVLTVERPGEEPQAEPVEAGGVSTTLPLKLAAPLPSPPSTAGAAVPINTEDRPGVFVRLGRYVLMGIQHILPGGLDHVLFVLGLFLFCTRLRPLVAQVTAFTVAHSLTLGLSLYGLVRLPAMVVEPLITLSIAFIAVENLRTTRFSASRVLVVFLFGLLHGLGFARALLDLGLPQRDFLTALIGFNGGVEIGQLTVIVFAAPTILLLRPWKYYRPLVVYPLSGGIALVAAWWTVRRVFF